MNASIGVPTDPFAKKSLRTIEHHIISHCPEDTVRIGAFLGKYLAGGSVVALAGKLGSGKTCLTLGIARGLKVPKEIYITSPSYSIVNEYPGRLTLFHVDFYRLKDPSELEYVDLDEILEAGGVVVIEWAEKFPGILPEEHLFVSISIMDDQTRELHLTAYGQQAAYAVTRLLHDLSVLAR